MIFVFFAQFVLTAINAFFSWLPQVTALPVIAGVSTDDAVSLVFDIMRGLIEALPPIATVWYGLLFIYGVKLTLLTWTFIRWVIGLIRGGS